MEKVYLLLEKDLDTEYVRVQGVYSTLKNAEDEMWFLMEFNEEQKSYKIEVKYIEEPSFISAQTAAEISNALARNIG